MTHWMKMVAWLTERGWLRILPVLFVIFLGACGTRLVEPPFSSGGSTPQAKTLTPADTAVQSIEATEVPDALRIWLDPSLPSFLRQQAVNLTSMGDRPIEIVEDSEEAHILLEPGAEVPITTWVYALVAPFPTVTDAWSIDELERVWRGEDEVGNFYVPQEHVEALRVMLGTPSEGGVLGVEETYVIEAAWADQPSFAIVPFEALEPRWKVLEVEGDSPIRKSFDETQYPLVVTFGLSGDSAAIDELADMVHWPESNRDPGKMTTVVMTGVTALTRATAWMMESKGVEFPAEKIGHWLSEADFTHISNEVSFWDDCPPPKPVREGLDFCSHPSYIPLFDAIGVDVIELTGNHLKDFGEEGLLQSLDIYRENSWLYFGGGENLEDSLNPVLFEHNGNRIAFFGCNLAGPVSVWADESSPGATPCSNDAVFSEVVRLKSEGYMTIFTYQWFEYYEPWPVSKQMLDFQEAVNAGALIVSGSQAHRPQGFEFYQDAFIHYGLGNLFFDQMWALGTRQQFIDRHVFYDGRHISTELLTAMLEEFAQPRPMTDEERTAFLEEIFAASVW